MKALITAETAIAAVSSPRRSRARAVQSAVGIAPSPSSTG